MGQLGHTARERALTLLFDCNKSQTKKIEKRASQHICGIVFLFFLLLFSPSFIVMYQNDIYTAWWCRVIYTDERPSLIL